MRGEDDVDAIESGTRFVDERWREDMGVIERQQLAPALPRVAKAGEGVAVGGWRLIPLIVLHHVIGVEAVGRAELLSEISGSLMDVDWRRCGCNEYVAGRVRQRKQRDELLDDGIVAAYRRTLQGAQHWSAQRHALTLDQAFIA